MENETKPSIERVDRYIILVDGHRVRADMYTEEKLRTFNAAGVSRFLEAMGHKEGDGCKSK